MPKTKPNQARPGDRLIRIQCCEGARLVKAEWVGRWSCAVCGGHGRETGRFMFESDMTMVELSTKETRSYR